MWDPSFARGVTILKQLTPGNDRDHFSDLQPVKQALLLKPDWMDQVIVYYIIKRWDDRKIVLTASFCLISQTSAMDRSPKAFSAKQLLKSDIYILFKCSQRYMDSSQDRRTVELF